MTRRFSRFIIIGLACVARCWAAEPIVLGIVYKDEPVAFDLVYKNTGPASVTLSDVKAACDCITIIDRPTTVAAGATAQITCQYRSAKLGRIMTDVIVLGSATSPAPLATYAISGFVADKSALLSSAEVARRLNDVVLIDTRAPARFAEVHVPRALNLPLFAIKTRSDLRSKELVLIDAGFEPTVLLAEVISLHAQGFNRVSVLEGGMASWLRQNHVVEGSNPEPQAVTVAEITPAEFFRARTTGIWQGLVIGPTLDRNLEELFPAGYTQTNHTHDFKAALAALPVVGEGQGRIVVIHSERVKPAEIEAQFSPAGKRAIYYLKGGLQALVSYQAEGAALAANTGQTLQTKAIRRTPVVSGSCGSCGQ
jgi:rhodanese-related sulfurtransferase